MNLKFIKKVREDGIQKGRISFWSFPKERYDFVITYEDYEDVNIFEKELKLNLMWQLDLDLE